MSFLCFLGPLFLSSRMTFSLQNKFKREIFAMLEKLWLNDRFISIFALYISSRKVLLSIPFFFTDVKWEKIEQNCFWRIFWRLNFRNCIIFYLRKIPINILFCIYRTRNKNVQLTFHYSYTICKDNISFKVILLPYCENF